MVDSEIVEDTTRNLVVNLQISDGISPIKLGCLFFLGGMTASVLYWLVKDYYRVINKDQNPVPVPAPTPAPRTEILRLEPLRHRNHQQSNLGSSRIIPIAPPTDCSICLQALSPPMELLPCHHIFHKNCIIGFFNRNGCGQYQRCPVCHSELTIQQLSAYLTR